MQHRWLSIVVGLSVLAACSKLSAPPLPPPPRHITELPGAGDFARQSFRAPLSIEDAEQILLRTNVFAFGGMPPKRQVQAFNVLLDQPDAMTRFESVAERGGLAGKLYALCAFSTLNAAKAAAMALELSKDQAQISVVEHDEIRSSMTTADIVALIQQRHLWRAMRAENEETTKYFNMNGREDR
jgi:hypothetical protein